MIMFFRSFHYIHVLLVRSQTLQNHQMIVSRNTRYFLTKMANLNFVVSLAINKVEDCRQLQDLIINDKTTTVSVHPVLLTVTGFTNVCKSDAIESALRLQKSPLHCSFTHHEIVASGIKKQKIRSVHSKLDCSFRFAIQSGFETNYGKALLREEVENNSTFSDNSYLKKHVHTLAQYLQQRQMQIDISKQADSPTFSPQTDTIHLERSLHNGVGLANIWDVSINKSVRPFIEAMGCCLTTNQTWLFIDLDQISKLYLPTESDEHDSFKLQWRSRVHYLLRMCQMSKHTKPNDGFTKFCRIFAVHDSPADIKLEIEKLRNELENAAEQMGVHKLINFEIKPLRRSNLNVKDLRKTFKSMLSHLEGQEVSMSWLFLRSSISEHKGFYISRAELKALAKECNIIGDHFQGFCSFFTSFGSILDPHKITKHSEYVVIKPQEFLRYLETFFGKVSSYDTFTEQDEVVLKILIDVTLALRHKNSLDPSHCLPSLVNQHSKMLPVQTKGTPGAMQVVLSMGSPKMSMGIEVIKKLLTLKVKSIPACTTYLRFSTEYSNSMDILVRSEAKESIIEAKITLIFQGDITEIVIKNSNFQAADSMPQPFLKNLCIAIIKGIEKIFDERALYLGEDAIHYHFAICCTKDPYKDYVAFNAYRKRHILPNYELCSDCKHQFVNENKDIIKAWNNAISEVRI